MKSNITNLKFLGIMIDDTVIWKSHIEMITPKLSVACFVLRATKPFVSQDTLKMVYHSYFRCIINYGIIFWGNSSYSSSIFKLQNGFITIIVRMEIRDSCREFFRILNILPLISQYKFFLVLFVANNKNQFRLNSEVHSIYTINNFDFIQPLLHLIAYKKGPFYVDIKVYNSLLPEI
jgi:hypothetical protein